MKARKHVGALTARCLVRSVEELVQERANGDEIATLSNSVNVGIAVK